MKKLTQSSNVTLAVPYTSVSQAVAELTRLQRARLLGIVRRRFASLPQSPQVQRVLSQREPLDFVQEAVMLVLVGEARPAEGRHAHVHHLASPAAFFNFLQGVLQSLISASLKSECRATAYQPMPEASAPRTAVQEAILNEVKADLAARLRAVAGDNPALQSTLLWLGLESPAAYCQPTRNQIWKMRGVARGVLREFAAGSAVHDLFQLEP